MAINRSVFAGDTNFMGANISEMINYLNEWCSWFKKTNKILFKNLEIVKNSSLDSYKKRDITAYVNFFSNKFNIYFKDIKRVITEVKSGVYQRHISTLDQVYRDSQSMEAKCVNFKDHYSEVHDTDKVGNAMNDIYSYSREMLIDLQDLSNLNEVLATHITTREDEDIIDVKPNFFGIGVNINAFWKKIKRKFRIK